ncbi:MAG TPA: MOSC domain-containing protein [Pirellulales bacterium]|nr:MOSC domain-containing protein [Pirellulales bacterium]
MGLEGRVVSLHITASGEAIMQTVDRALAIAGRGLDGDRYFNGCGTYSNRPGSGRQITLIESEALEALERDYGVDIEPAQARRNIVTCAVALNHLVGREFVVGEARLRGMRLCACAHLENLSARGALRGLIRRGGLRADVVSGGIIRVGDSVTAHSDRFE